MLSPDGITWIGDRPAQLGALVTSADLRYVADKLTPFEVYERVEQYVNDHIHASISVGTNTSVAAGPRYTARYTAQQAARWRAFMTTQRRIVLSTGLMWAVKYEGMVVKQLMKLLSSAFVTPRIFVLPVPENVLVGREANTKLLSVCTRSQVIRDNVIFLGTYMGIQGDATWQAQPTPAEVLAVIDLVNNTHMEHL